jgi:ADP-heptose:LPS heptosyltransferase
VVSEQTAVQQILVIRASKDIDLSTTHWFIKALKQKFPHASSTLMNGSPILSPQNSWVEDTLSRIITDSPPTAEMLSHCIETIQSRAFDAAFILNRPSESPYFWGYICYLANIPIRVGLTKEFGGAVLSHAVKVADSELASAIDDYVSLLNSVEEFNPRVPI